VETFVTQLVQAGGGRGVESTVCILGHDGPVAEQLRDYGATVTLLDAASMSRPVIAALFAQVLLKGHFDLVHAHSGGRMVRLLSSRFGAKVLNHLHGLLADWIPHALANDAVFRRRVAELSSGADEVAVSSRYMAGLLSGADCAKPVVQLSYGVDVERFKPATPEQRDAARLHLGIAADAHVVGFAGRLVPQKGIHHLIGVAGLLSSNTNISIVVLGDGPLRQQAEQNAHDSGLRNIVFVGSTLDVPDIMAAFDLMLLTSDWEPFGIVNIESMSMGVPVVAFDVGGVSESVTDDVTGILVPPGDVSGMAHALVQLLGDAGRRAEMGVAGRARVEQDFDTKRTTAAVFDHYDDILKQGA